MLKNLFFYILYAAISSFGLYEIKISNLTLNYNLILGGIFYVVGFLIWLVILKMNPLSTAFPIAAGSLIIATQIIGFFFLSEGMDVRKLIGIILIILGFVFINKMI